MLRRDFFLETVEDVDCVTKAQGINRSIRAPQTIFDNFHNASMAEALERLAVDMFAASLRKIQRITKCILHRRWHL